MIKALMLQAEGCDYVAMVVIARSGLTGIAAARLLELSEFTVEYLARNRMPSSRRTWGSMQLTRSP